MPKNISIAEAVLGVPPSVKGYKAVIQAYQTVTGQAISVGQIKKANRTYEQCTDRQRIEMSINEIDRLVTVSGLHQIFIERELQNSSVLADWPTYAQLMKHYGRPADGSASALLLGCQSSLSAKAFTVLAQEEYGANRPYIIDLEASDYTRRIGNFVLADALSLPFRSESMDFVQTDQLFHRFYDPSGQYRTLGQKTERLFSEAARVLAPGGQLLLREITPNPNDPALARLPCQELTAAMARMAGTQLTKEGFSDINAAMPVDPVVPDFLLDPSRDLSALQGYDTGQVMMLYARKPEA
ncbi:MAG TPA: class I SAM-dependent methyltransferase [Candidatus Saccharimonadales bacterium]|nr:class I SAM-dependent methyltransferase [Candidatus Saccharimonadales bacterium]